MRRRFAGPAMAIAASVAVGCVGCARIPTSGSVHIGRVIAPGGEDPEVARAGLSSGFPVNGMSRSDVVLGFLRAQEDDRGSNVARAYLTPKGGERWHPGASPTVYNDVTLSLRPLSRHRIDLQTFQTGTITPSGQISTTHSPLSITFGFSRVGGQWRIADPPKGRLLGKTELQQIYQEYNLGFLNEGESAEVELPVVEPSTRSGLATSLVRALLAGPPGRIRGSVTTAIPHGTQLFGNIALDSAGYADVDLTGAVGQLPANRIALVLDQLTLTLHGAPGVTGVQLSVDNAPLTVPGVATRVSLSTARRLQPVAGVDTLGLVDQGGLTHQFAEQSVEGHPAVSQPAEGLLGSDWPRIAALGWAPGGLAVASVMSPGKTRLITGSVDGQPHLLRQVGNVNSLQVLGRRGLAVINHRRLLLIRRGRAHVVTGVPRRLTALGIHAAALAPGGSKVALLVGPTARERIAVAGLRPDAKLVGTQVLGVPLSGARGLAWSAADTMVTTDLGARGSRQLLQIDGAGFAPRSSFLPARLADLTALCAAPGSPTAVVAHSELWLNNAGAWSAAGPASNCSYAGALPTLVEPAS